jgi:hypothetical protein
VNGNVFDSEGRHVAVAHGGSIYDLTGKEIYKLRDQKIYRLTGELVGHVNAVGSNMRLDRSNDRLFSK